MVGPEKDNIHCEMIFIHDKRDRNLFVHNTQIVKTICWVHEYKYTHATCNLGCDQHEFHENEDICDSLLIDVKSD